MEVMQINTNDTINSKADLWANRVHAFQKSGLSRKDWCQQNDVPQSTLGYWIRKTQLESHMANASILKYNDENSLRYVVRLAYYHAMNEYIIIDEMPSGKGYADLMFIPRPLSDKPAMVVELKYNKSAEGAIAQIKKQRYMKSLEGYKGRILLVGVNYHKDDCDKNHTCIIEEYHK